MSTPDEVTVRAQDLIRFVRDNIPLAQAMALELAGCSEHHLALLAPLAPNVNDKGCAFGGSLVSLMTLNGWGLVELALRGRGDDCDVFVAQSKVRYLAPVWQDLRSEARLAADGDWQTFFRTLDTRSKARISVECVVPDEHGKPACVLEARFVAKRRG